MYPIEELIGDFKKFRDPIYGFILVPSEFLPIIDHKLFQRLRWVGQLPLEQLVYPSAQHSRFEHSLGVMYLSMIAAISLLNNSRKQISKAFREDAEFSKLKSAKEKRKKFILTAGLAGLLHDVGHAPYSHTLEAAYESSELPIEYHHEKIGYLIAKEIVGSLNNSNLELCINKTLTILNKKLDESNAEMTSIPTIIRKLISGPIDTDRGDYLIRDAYHCGVSYGIYDREWLWRNVLIIGKSAEYQLGIRGKAAIQGWRLLFARYEMSKNVYQHHVRNITDSMLIDIITTSFKKIENCKREQNQKRKLKTLIIPILKLDSDRIKDTEIEAFARWTDNSLLNDLKTIAKEFKCKDIKLYIDRFIKRELFKNVNFKFDISAHQGDKGKVFNEMNKIKQKLKKEGIHFTFLIQKEVIPPVFDEAILGGGKEEKVIWVKDERARKPKYVKLGEYLDLGSKTLAKILRPEMFALNLPRTDESRTLFYGFIRRLEKEDFSLYIRPRYFLHIFPDKKNKRQISRIRRVVEDFRLSLQNPS